MEAIIITVWFLSAFAWAVKDVNSRMDIHGIHPRYVFVFLFNFIFMPVLAFIEKMGEHDDYVRVVRNWIGY